MPNQLSINNTPTAHIPQSSNKSGATLGGNLAKTQTLSPQNNNLKLPSHSQQPDMRSANNDDNVFVLVQNWDNNEAPTDVVDMKPVQDYTDSTKTKTMFSALDRYEVQNAQWIANTLDTLEGMDATTDKIERAGKSSSTIQLNDVVLYGFLTGETKFFEQSLHASENQNSIAGFLNATFNNHIVFKDNGTLKEPIKMNNLAFIGELLSKPEMFLLAEYHQDKSNSEPAELKHGVGLNNNGNARGWKFNMSKQERQTQLKQIAAFYDKLQNNSLNTNAEALKLVQQFMRNIPFTQCVKSLRAGEAYENLSFTQTYCPNGVVNVNRVLNDLKPLADSSKKVSTQQATGLAIYMNMPQALVNDHQKFVIARMSS